MGQARPWCGHSCEKLEAAAWSVARTTGHAEKLAVKGPIFSACERQLLSSVQANSYGQVSALPRAGTTPTDWGLIPRL